MGKDTVLEYFGFYNIICVPDGVTKEEATEEFIKKHANILNINIDRAREALYKVNPFYIIGVGKIM